MFKKAAVYFLFSVFCVSATAAEAPEIRKQETMFFNDIYEQNVHSEAVNQLDLSRWGRKLFNNPLRSKNVNLFDEVPDSHFFTNRHARSPMAADQLVKGFAENAGPDSRNGLKVVRVENSGIETKVFVTDGKEDNYLLKFDAAENVELATSAEIIASRVYYALGYNVPQYTLENLEPEVLTLSKDSEVRQKSGFLNPLSREKLEEILMFVPQTMEGQYRVSAVKILDGEQKGFFSFNGRRKADPEDIVNHRDRREVRALIVFGAWLNNNDIRESNTLDILVNEDGKQILKHYLIDFNGSLGSAHGGVKPPHFGYEHMMDFGEAAKAFFTLGFWEKPWQKHWREAEEKSHPSSAVGYFDNREFNPGKYKAQLPYEAFKRLTRADGFWAAKQIGAFSDQDIRALVSSGKLSEAEDAEYIAKTLIERRDLITQYWFSQSTPLDDFEVKSGKLVFKDLAVERGFEKPETRVYQACAVNESGKKIKDLSIDASGVTLDADLFSGGVQAVIEIRTGADAPYVHVRVSEDSVLSVLHQD